MTSSPDEGRPVFLDPSGRRRSALRGVALVLGVLSTLAVAVLVANILAPPLLPYVPLVQRASDSLGNAPRAAAPPRDYRISRRAERERIASREALFAQLSRTPLAPSRPLTWSSARTDIRRGGPGDPIVAGFYVNWDDNAFASLKAHVDRLDWVVGEWGLLTPSGGVRFQIDRRVLALAEQQAEPPRLVLMVTNYIGTDFDAAAVRRLAATPASRQAFIRTVIDTAQAYGLGGVMLDFELLGPREHPLMLALLRELRAALRPLGLPLSTAVPGDDEAWPLAEYAAVNDYLLLMLYDEHDPAAEPGPLASDSWYAHHLRRILAVVPRDQAIAGIGAFAYGWTDTLAFAREYTFQDVMRLAREAGVTPEMDPQTRNPFLAWTGADSVDHLVWYLDATTAWNQLRRAHDAGTAGVGVWRLGSEDPSLWQVLGRRATAGDPAALDTIRFGYDVDFTGTGEILRLTARPTLGTRENAVQADSGLIVRSRITTLPSNWTITRYGRQKRKVALTFDDGPSAEWTAAILDTLADRQAPATFFIIGTEAEKRPRLLRRMLEDGHELGNHTFTHPNLARASARATRVELAATERLIEAVTGRQATLFRPPYFGDAEPTTPDELEPIAVAQELGYITVGLRNDPLDWENPPPATIIARTLGALDTGNVVLLHDGGGDRSATVAAVGPLVDSLRGRGYEVVTVGELAGVTREQSMPAVEGRSAISRFIELGSWTALGWTELALRAVFLAAMALGALRLAFIMVLAVWQKTVAVPRREQRAPTDYQPRVTALVPAYREEVVIVRTIRSLLAQDYPHLDVVVIDDGSPDRTYEVCAAAFADEPRVTLVRKSNGGKASALNTGLTRATGEIVVAVDADTVFPPDAIRELIRPLADPRTAAVAGNAKVGNRLNTVTRFQAIEYVTSQNLDRRAFELLNGITVVPGAIGAWRRDLVRQVGGFSDATLAEDQDLTMTLLRFGFRIAYADRAVAYTEAPDTFRALAKQRFRWSYGTLQCAWKHRAAFLRREAGGLGFVGLPNIWLFQIGFTLLAPVADLLFGWSLVTIWLNQLQHGPEYALQSLQQVASFYGLFLLVDGLTAMVALWLEPGEEKELAWLVVLQRFVYRQVLYWVVLRAVGAALAGGAFGWGKLERKGTVSPAAS